MIILTQDIDSFIEQLDNKIANEQGPFLKRNYPNANNESLNDNMSIIELLRS